MTEPYADPITVKAIARARTAHGRAYTRFAAQHERLDSHELELDESREDVEALARDALEHLDAGRWDEARECAEQALNLAESACASTCWREFGLLVEEAAEIGHSAAQLEEDG